MKNKVLIIGAGGHARSVLDILLQNDEYEIVGCIDNAFGKREVVEGMEEIPIVGNDNALEEFRNKGIKKIFIAIGSNELRDELYDYVSLLGFELINVISSSAYISPRAKLGNGICVMPGAVINVNAVIEDNCIINTNCSIDHDCKIGRSVHIAPGVAISGTVSIGDRTQVGTGASIIDGINVGNDAFIGAGAAVVMDIEEYALAVGVPARMIKKLKGE